LINGKWFPCSIGYVGASLDLIIKEVKCKLEMAANGYSFAFGRAFGKLPARNCCRPKIQKLKI